MDEQRASNADDGQSEREPCTHEISFNLSSEKGNKLSICMSCGLIHAKVRGADVEGRIEAIEPLVQAVGELIKPIIKRGT